MSQPFSTQPISDMAVKAMEAGLNGDKLPNFGRLTAQQLEVVNSIYEAARNRRAGDRIIVLRVR